MNTILFLVSEREKSMWTVNLSLKMESSLMDKRRTSKLMLLFEKVIRLGVERGGKVRLIIGSRWKYPDQCPPRRLFEGVWRAWTNKRGVQHDSRFHPRGQSGLGLLGKINTDPFLSSSPLSLLLVVNRTGKILLRYYFVNLGKDSSFNHVKFVPQRLNFSKGSTVSRNCAREIFHFFQCKGVKITPFLSWMGSEKRSVGNKTLIKTSNKWMEAGSYPGDELFGRTSVRKESHVRSDK